MPRFLAAFDESPVRSLAEIVRFNEQNKDICLPPRTSSRPIMYVCSSKPANQYLAYTEQSDLIKALENDDTEAHVEELKVGLRALGKQILDQVFDEKDVNIIAAPADCSQCIHAAAAGPSPFSRSE